MARALIIYGLALAITAGGTIAGGIAFLRAVDAAAVQYVTFTRDGRTFTCERHIRGHGNVYYGPCDEVAP